MGECLKLEGYRVADILERGVEVIGHWEMCQSLKRMWFTTVVYLEHGKRNDSANPPGKKLIHPGRLQHILPRRITA